MISLSRLAPTPTHPIEHDQPLVGILYKLASVLILAIMSACIKWLGPEFPTGQIMFYRSLFAVPPILLAAALGEGLHLLKAHSVTPHAMRSITGAGAMFCTFSALTLIPLADAVSIGFAAPLFIVVLAVITLGERVHLYRWSAVAVGFMGVILMIGPHFETGTTSLLGASFALAGAVLTAASMILIRRMSAQEHSITIAFYFSLTCAAVGLCTLVTGWHAQSPMQTGVLVMTGLLGGVGQLFLTLSYRYAEASVIAPLDYTNMIWATILGYFVFGELPTTIVWAGSIIVISAGLLILWREHRRKIVRPSPL